ncbi:hypothetical protein [Paenibacillus sp. JDR-2]|uniref:hypothetical protein n=1 Tax=Paenibacillus sp. (strain JDR-2) TaxID=324057 RepID=UPI0001669702|nr:hypothetical protein [Paenibacillus sp. JDR-2]ACT01646.1 hypothetical protein Pjdr2_2999 [Paenibacillus sp. JDR-2]
MKLKMSILVALAVWLTACSVQTEKTVIPQITPSPDAAEASVESDNQDNTDTVKEDLSVRAVASHQAGTLMIQPKSQAMVTVLGAPSCYGLETDLSWTGDYEAIWKPAAGGNPVKVLSFPEDLEIIEPTDETVNLQMLTIGDTDIFTYYPRYTDCHALEAYLFGVKDGQVFPITFEDEAGQLTNSFFQHPHYPLQVSGNEELVITGGEGGGQAFIEVWHYGYDSVQHRMKLSKTDQVQPQDLLPSINEGGD